MSPEGPGGADTMATTTVTTVTTTVTTMTTTTTTTVTTVTTTTVTTTTTSSLMTAISWLKSLLRDISFSTMLPSGGAGSKGLGVVVALVFSAGASRCVVKWCESVGGDMISDGDKEAERERRQRSLPGTHKPAT